jgi:hypothetical protein
MSDYEKSFSNERDGLSPEAEPQVAYDAPTQAPADRDQASGPAPTPLAMNNPLSSARAGNPKAKQGIHSMGPGAAMALLFRPLPSPVATQFKSSTCEDVSAVQIAENPALAEQGKRGVARDGRCVEVAPGLLDDRALCFHELVHIVQQRGPAHPPKQASSTDPEAEAVSGSRAILANQPFEITVQSSQKELFEDPKTTHSYIQRKEVEGPIDENVICVTPQQQLPTIPINDDEKSSDQDQFICKPVAHGAEFINIPTQYQSLFTRSIYENVENLETLDSLLQRLDSLNDEERALYTLIYKNHLPISDNFQLHLQKILPHWVNGRHYPEAA